ncbi:MAG: FtsX-like permease family protein [Gammaproteobacteria bacterium]|nr:FtsX-like permease family protein [Gammaproteobacteria bacterium]
MKYLHLIWAALFRSKTRTILTLLSVVAAFLLFGMLDSVRVAFASGGDVAGANRMVVTSRFSIIQPLPYSLNARIQAVPGVKQVAFANWFGGIYQDPKNFFPNFAIGPGFFELYPEYRIPAEQLEKYQDTRTGAIVGAALAERFGWTVGDKIPLQATIFPNETSGNAWTFDLAGIFRVTDSKRRGEENQMMFHWEYFDEANAFGSGNVGWYIVKLADGADANEVAQTIDGISANSDHETKTQTEQAFNQAFLEQFADVGLIVSAIMAAVFFTLLLLTGNTMAQAVRERIPELAVLKTIGFSNRAVLGLVLVESILLVLIGGLIGLALAAVLMPGVSASSNGLINLPTVPAQTWAMGIVLILAIGLVVGMLPALRAMRLNIVDALAGR